MIPIAIVGLNPLLVMPQIYKKGRTSQSNFIVLRGILSDVYAVSDSVMMITNLRLADTGRWKPLLLPLWKSIQDVLERSSIECISNMAESGARDRQASC